MRKITNMAGPVPKARWLFKKSILVALASGPLGSEGALPEEEIR